MSRKHFESIAETIRESGSRFKSNEAHARFASAMAVTLAQSNERFDFARFMSACMPSWMVGTSKSNVWERVSRQMDVTHF